MDLKTEVKLLEKQLQAQVKKAERDVKDVEWRMAKELDAKDKLLKEAAEERSRELEAARNERIKQVGAQIIRRIKYRDVGLLFTAWALRVAMRASKMRRLRQAAMRLTNGARYKAFTQWLGDYRVAAASEARE